MTQLIVKLKRHLWENIVLFQWLKAVKSCIPWHAPEWLKTIHIFAKKLSNLSNRNPCFLEPKTSKALYRAALAFLHWGAPYSTIQQEKTRNRKVKHGMLKWALEAGGRARNRSEFWLFATDLPRRPPLFHMAENVLCCLFSDLGSPLRKNKIKILKCTAHYPQKELCFTFLFAFQMFLTNVLNCECSKLWAVSHHSYAFISCSGSHHQH